MPQDSKIRDPLLIQQEIERRRSRDIGYALWSDDQIRAEIEEESEKQNQEKATPIHKSPEIQTNNHLIDCDADPFIPSYLKEVVSHQRDGRFVFDPTKIKLYLSPNQKNGKFIKGEQLQTELANESVLNANILDYLLANPIIIPDEWKGKCIFFWGTVYRGSRGGLYVRYLYFRGGEWRSDDDWLGRGWRGGDPAAVRAS